MYLIHADGAVPAQHGYIVGSHPFGQKKFRFHVTNFIHN